MLYYFEEIETLDEDYLERCIPFLSDDRQQKVLSLPTGNEQIRSAATYM